MGRKGRGLGVVGKMSRDGGRKWGNVEGWEEEWEGSVRRVQQGLEKVVREELTSGETGVWGTGKLEPDYSVDR